MGLAKKGRIKWYVVVWCEKELDEAAKNSRRVEVKG